MYSSNPFNKSIEELTKESMNNTNQFNFASNLNLGELLLPVNNAYNPYPELEEQALKNNEGGENTSFDERQDKFVKPKFSDLEPNKLLMGMNVNELQNDFDRQDAVKSHINFLFNPQEGNTPEERAKSKQINTLLAEIDNFAIQYNLSQRQIEQLKTQVLSNHLGEYIQTKSNIEKSDIETQRQEAMDLAGGRRPDRGGVVRDPTTMDDNNMRPDAEAIENELPSSTKAIDDEENMSVQEILDRYTAPTSGAGTGEDRDTNEPQKTSTTETTQEKGELPRGVAPLDMGVLARRNAQELKTQLKELEGTDEGFIYLYFRDTETSTLINAVSNFKNTKPRGRVSDTRKSILKAMSILSMGETLGSNERKELKSAFRVLKEIQ